MSNMSRPGDDQCTGNASLLINIDAHLVRLGVCGVPDAEQEGAGRGLAEGLAVSPGSQIQQALQGSAPGLLADFASGFCPASGNAWHYVAVCPQHSTRLQEALPAATHAATNC